MNKELYQKTGLTVNLLVQEFIGKEIGDRIDSISDYQERYMVSRGTVQNALQILKETGAIKLKNRGTLGTYLTEIDYKKLMEFAPSESILGIMPLPYSKLYEGMASALIAQLRKSPFFFNMAYVRGAEARIELVLNHGHDFAISSRHAAKECQKHGYEIEIIHEFGELSFLSEHVLVTRDENIKEIEDGMKVAIDLRSTDHRDLTYTLIKGLNIQLIDVPANQVVQAVSSGLVDVGVWNLDEILEKGYRNLHYTKINNPLSKEYSTAVMVIKKNDELTRRIINTFIDVQEAVKMQQEVVNGNIIPSY